MISLYPSTDQFRGVIKKIHTNPEYIEKDLPTLLFKVTVKMHGTNAAVVNKSGSELIFQSRKKVVTPTSDNAGFATWASGEVYSNALLDIILSIRANCSIKNINGVVLYGEWCCGNIAKGVSLNDIKEKQFIIFAIKEISSNNEFIRWWDTSPFTAGFDRIHFIDEFEVDSINIDFELPGLCQPRIEAMTNAVEENCPVGSRLKQLYPDSDSTSTIGEGIVMTHISGDGQRLVFKSKGKKHSSSAIKVMGKIDVEKQASIHDFVEYAVTENRLTQMLEEMEEPLDIRNIGIFIKAVNCDVVKEEIDTLSESNLTMKNVGGSISRKARMFYFEKLKE